MAQKGKAADCRRRNQKQHHADKSYILGYIRMKEAYKEAVVNT